MNTEQFDHQLFEEFFGEQPQAIIWLQPTYNSANELIDFHYAYCNQEGIKYLGIDRHQMGSLFLSNSPTLTDKLREDFMQELSAIMETEQKSLTNIFNPRLNKYAKVLRYKFRGGVLSIVQDVTEENKIIGRLQEETSFSNSILDTSLSGIFAAKAIRNEYGVLEDFLILRINPAFTQLMLLQPEEVVGKRFLELFPAAKDMGVFELHKKVCDTGITNTIEVYYPRGKEPVWYYISSVKWNDGIVVTFTDVTEQKQATKLIEQNRSLLQNILQHSPAGISVTEVIRDKEGKIIDGRSILANDISSEFTQIPKEILLTKTINEIDPNFMKSHLYQQVLHTLATGKSFYTQYFLQPTQRWLELSVSKMDDDHLINIFMDITAAKEAQLHLKRSLEDLKRSNENLEEFAYAASHDLKEPIRKVLMFSDMLKTKLAKTGGAEEKLFLDKIEKATHRMKQLVEDLLLYSQVNQEQNLDEEVNLNDKVHLVLEDLELLIREKGAKITVDKLPTITGHRRQMQQLFTNLISNALKYSKPDVTPEVQITAAIVRGEAIGLPLTPEELGRQYHAIQIKDNGIGFESSEAEKIFNVFTRLHNNSAKGTGIGLAIVRKVVANHHGYIKAEGEKGIGATFTIYLPA